MTEPQEYTIRRGPFKGKNARELTPKEMLTIITTMRRTVDADAGIKMMRFILEKKGVEGVIEFVEWGQKVLDNTGMILKSDFMPTDGSKPTKEEKQMLAQAKPGMSRRSFLLNVAPWMLIAGTGIAHSGAGMLESAIRNKPKEVEPDADNAFGRVRQWIDNHGQYELEMIGSVSLAYLAINDWNEDKFQQISNGVAEMGQILGVSERLPSYRLNSKQQNGR